MTYTIKQLEDKLRIDEHALEVSLREHPELFYKVATELALAISNRDEAKQDLEEVEALVDMEIRKDASAVGGKTTEKEIDSLKKADERVITASDKFMEERYNAAKWSALKEAYEQKSYALYNLTELYISNYYSSNENAGKVTVREAKAQKAREVINERRRVSV